MSISTPFIQRPVATTLLLVAVTLAGGIAYTLLPVSALPEVDFPTIIVSASLPGASPEVMAASVATPLEKQFTRIAGVTEMTSRSSVGSAPGRAPIRSEPRHQRGGARSAGGHQLRGRISARESALAPQIPENQSGRPADSADDARIGRGAEAAVVRHRLLGVCAEAGAGAGRRPGSGGRKLASRGSRGSESAAALPLQRGSRPDRHVPAGRQCEQAEGLARELRRARFRSTPPTSFSWRRTTRIWWWSTATARRSACRTWAASSMPTKTSATSAWSTATRWCRSRSAASRTPTSSTRWRGSRR